jgi:hypothetical protein
LIYAAQQIKHDVFIHPRPKTTLGPPLIIATDASNVAAGAVVVANGKNDARGFIIRRFDAKMFTAHIFLKETIAVLWAVEELALKIAERNQTVIVLIDNTAVMFALRRWFTSNAEAQKIVRRIWHAVNEKQLHLAFERIDSKHNPSDEPSRLFFPHRNKIENAARKWQRDNSCINQKGDQKSRPAWYDEDVEFVDVASCMGQYLEEGGHLFEEGGKNVCFSKKNTYGGVADGTYW